MGTFMKANYPFYFTELIHNKTIESTV